MRMNTGVISRNHMLKIGSGEKHPYGGREGLDRYVIVFTVHDGGTLPCC